MQTSSPRFLFDLAGVLIDWRVEPLYLELFDGDRAAIRDFFTNVFTAERQREICIGRGMSVVLDELVEQHPDHADAIRAWDERWDEIVLGPIEGTVAVLEGLRDRGHAVYALGNWSREEFDRALARFAFLGRFDGTVIAGDHGVMKPDRRLFEIALEQFGLVPADSVFIDDTATNVEAARELGFQGIVFESPRQLRAVLHERGWLGS